MKWIKEKGRIYQKSPEGYLLAEVTFPKEGEGVVNLDHTFVKDSLRGQGIAGELMVEVAEFSRKEHFLINPTCPYAIRWFEQHPEYSDCLA